MNQEMLFIQDNLGNQAPVKLSDNDMNLITLYASTHFDDRLLRVACINSGLTEQETDDAIIRAHYLKTIPAYY